MAAKIFISHSVHRTPENSLERQFADILVNTLRRNGVDVFFDLPSSNSGSGNISVGDEIPAQIKEGIYSSHGAVLIVSNEQEARYWVVKEFTLLSNKPTIHGTIICPVIFPGAGAHNKPISLMRDPDFIKLHSIILEDFLDKPAPLELISVEIARRFQNAHFLTLNILFIQTIHNRLCVKIRDQIDDTWILEWLNKIAGFHVGTDRPESRRSLLVQYFLSQIIYTDQKAFDTTNKFFKIWSLKNKEYFKIIGSSWSSIDSSKVASDYIFRRDGGNIFEFPRIKNWKFFLELFLWRAVAIEEYDNFECTIYIKDFSGENYSVQDVLDGIASETRNTDDKCFIFFCLNDLLVRKTFAQFAGSDRIVPVYISDVTSNSGSGPVISHESRNVLVDLSKKFVDFEKFAADFGYVPMSGLTVGTSTQPQEKL